MVGPLPHGTLLGMGNRAVPVEIPVPFSLLPVGEMSERIGMDFFKPPPIPVLPGQFVSGQSGNQRFVMYPPELHIPFELFTRPAVHIHEIQDAAVFFIPTPFQRPIEDLERFLQQPPVLCLLRLVHQKPGIFTGMARIDGAPGWIVQMGAIRQDCFQHAAQRGLIVDAQQVIRNLPGDPFVIRRFAGIAPPQHLGAAEKHHRHRRTALLPGGGIGLGGDLVGIGRGLTVKTQHQVKAGFRLVQRAGVPKGRRVFRHPDDVKALGKQIPPFPQRASVPRGLKKHPSVGVYAMAFEKAPGELRALPPRFLFPILPA